MNETGEGHGMPEGAAMEQPSGDETATTPSPEAPISPPVDSPDDESSDPPEPSMTTEDAPVVDTEHSPSKEVSVERQRKEAHRIGGTIINQEIKEQRAAVDKDGPSAIRPQGGRALLLLERINTDSDGALPEVIDLREDTEKQQPAITIRYNGQDVTLLNVSTRQGENYGGKIQFKDGTEPYVGDISQESILAGFFTTEGDNIIAGVTDEASKIILTSYMDSVKTGSEITPTPEFNAILLQAANEHGILSFDDFISYYEAKMLQGPIGEDEQKILDAVREQAVQSNILLSDELQQVIDGLNLPEGGALEGFVKSVALGEVSRKTARAFIDGFRAADVDKINEAYLATLPPEDQDAARKELALKIAEYGTMGLAGVLILLWHLTTSEAQAIKKSVK